MYVLIRFLAAEFVWKLKPKQPSTASSGSNANRPSTPPYRTAALQPVQRAFFKEKLGGGRDGARNSTSETRLATQTPILHPQSSGQLTDADACQPRSNRLQHTALCQYFLLQRCKSGYPAFQIHLSSSFISSMKLLGGSNLCSPPQHQTTQAKLIPVMFYIQGSLSFIVEPREIFLFQLGNYK